MLPAPATPGLVLGECPATGLPTQGLRALKQRQEICPRKESPLAIYVSFHLGSLGKRTEMEGERGKLSGHLRSSVSSNPQRRRCALTGAGTEGR